MTAASDELWQILRDEIARPISPEAAAIRDAIVAAHGRAVAAILFYGSCLRNATKEGILDFYVLVDDYRSYYGRGFASVSNRLLPPTVSLWTAEFGGETVRAKVAVISRDQFDRRLRARSLDVTIWARFCQPVALAHARDQEAADWVVGALGRAVVTAVTWALRLGPERGTARDYWCALFQNTYRAELRPEPRKDRADAIYVAAVDRYDRLFLLALAEVGVTVERGEDGFRIRRLADRRLGWRLRRILGKLMTVVRLTKAAFTFANGADYIAWKIERHSGKPLRLTPWQRAHPLLGAPLVLWRLWRNGAVR